MNLARDNFPKLSQISHLTRNSFLVSDSSKLILGMNPCTLKLTALDDLALRKNTSIKMFYAAENGQTTS